MDGESKMIDVQLPAGPLRLEITIRDGADELGPRFVELRRTD
jgi:hypothetical protein